MNKLENIIMNKLENILDCNLENILNKNYDNFIFNYDNILYNFHELILNYFNKYSENKLNIENLNNLHLILKKNILNKKDIEYYNNIPLFGINDRESILIKLFYQYYDNNLEIKEKYINFMKNIKYKHFSNEEYLVIQKTPNIRIHLPNCSNIGKLDTDPNKNIIGLHSDNMFGHPDEEFNIIIAITEMYNSNSIYYEKKFNKNKKNEFNKFNINDYESLNLNRNNYSILYLNKIKHFNKINKTGKTRISFDTRIIPYSKYNKNNKYSKTFNKKFEIGDYYIKI